MTSTRSGRLEVNLYLKSGVGIAIWEQFYFRLSNVSVEKFKMRSMCFSFASVLKCVRAAHEIQRPF